MGTRRTADLLTAPPCRYCGEHEWLTLNPEFVDDFYAHEADGSLVREDGEPKLHVVDFIECLICGAMAPAEIWRGEPVTAAMRAALDFEYRARGSVPEGGRS